MSKSFLFPLFLIASACQVFGQVGFANRKEATTRNVYNKLVNAFGDGRKAPELKFLGYGGIKDSIVAAYVPGDFPVIEIEEIAYDVCASFRKDSLNALACVLGHELAHYYLKHDWCSNFSRRLSHISIAAELNKIDKQEQLKKESEADYNGFYYGSVAGYKTFDIAPALLRKLYITYKLNPTLKGYPTLDQRIEAATQSKAMVLRRLPVFNAGACLYDIGEYEMAFDCFNNLISDFTSRENYNNAAVCKMQLALGLFEPYEMPFCFPFEFDYDTRIAGSSNRSGTPQSEEKRKVYLTEARKLLDECIRRDPGYSMAKINLAICYIMLDNPDMASGILREIELDTTVEKRVLSSIVMAKKGDLSKALAELSSISNDTIQVGLIANNKTLFALASERKLNIGDDELGYQLRKLDKISPSSFDGQNSIVADCLKEKSEKLYLVKDSIRVSDHTSIVLLKGNEEVEKAIVVKGETGGKQFGFYLFKNPSSLCSFQDSLTAGNARDQYFRGSRVISTKILGERRFLFVTTTD